MVINEKAPGGLGCHGQRLLAVGVAKAREGLLQDSWVLCLETLIGIGIESFANFLIRKKNSYYIEMLYC